jgi:hypothetical protein
MAWKLRQSVEGDRIVTVEGVDSAVGNCWIDSNGDYVPNSIAIRINGISYPLYNILSLSFGFLFINIPNNVFIGANTNVQVYSTCDPNPEYITLSIPSKPINFTINTEGITSCSTQAVINASIKDYIRLFFAGTVGAPMRLRLGTSSSNAYLDMSDFTYQIGDSADITSEAGFFTRNTEGPNASLFSNQIYSNYLITITVITTNYFTIRGGSLEIIFDGSSIRYINYLSGDKSEIYLAHYDINDEYNFIGTPEAYVFSKKTLTGLQELLRLNKVATYEVSGGTLNPVIAVVGTPITWNHPAGNGEYTFTVSLVQGMKYKKTIIVHSCGNAVPDNYVGAYNQPYQGNVSTNDELCTGETTYVQLVEGSIVGGSLNLNSQGAFTFFPDTDFEGEASFTYERYCGNTTSNIYEKVGTAIVTITYDNSCSSILPVWIDTDNVRCIKCYPEKEQEDTNFLCSGTTSNRWIPVADNSICDQLDDWQNTNETKCKFAHKFIRQINLNKCSTGFRERWVDLGLNTDCDCCGEVFITTNCKSKYFYPVIKLLSRPEEDNRAFIQCLFPDISENTLFEKQILFETLNDGNLYDYVITLFDCNHKLISQTILQDYNCFNSFSATGFNYIFNFSV